jgi:hypothetical protein
MNQYSWIWCRCSLILWFHCLLSGAGQVIRGWDESFGQMKVGERRQIILPPRLAYGKSLATYNCTNVSDWNDAAGCIDSWSICQYYSIAPLLSPPYRLSQILPYTCMCVYRRSWYRAHPPCFDVVF